MAVFTSLTFCHPLNHTSSWSHPVLHWPAGARGWQTSCLLCSGLSLQEPCRRGAQEEACATSQLLCSHLCSNAWLLHNLFWNNLEKCLLGKCKIKSISILHLKFLFKSSAICCELEEPSLPSLTNPQNAPQSPQSPKQLLGLQSAPAANAHSSTSTKAVLWSSSLGMVW